MCGFIGCVYDHKDYPKLTEEQFKLMNDIIYHRGPDHDGFYQDEHVQLGFRRLSIIDLENGNQPLSFENERYWIIFNGEIYNYVELREELLKEGVEFATSSDTETIVALYSRLKEKAVEKLRGMFAFVIWDKEEQVLFGARDPFGIKPFFYKEEGGRTFLLPKRRAFCLPVKKAA